MKMKLQVEKEEFLSVKLSFHFRQVNNNKSKKQVFPPNLRSTHLNLLLQTATQAHTSCIPSQKKCHYHPPPFDSHSKNLNNYNPSIDPSFFIKITLYYFWIIHSTMILFDLQLIAKLAAAFQTFHSPAISTHHQ